MASRTMRQPVGSGSSFLSCACPGLVLGRECACPEGRRCRSSVALATSMPIQTWFAPSMEMSLSCRCELVRPLRLRRLQVAEFCIDESTDAAGGDEECEE